MVDGTLRAFVSLIVMFFALRLVDCEAARPRYENWVWLLSCLIFKKRVSEFRAIFFEFALGGIIFVFILLYVIIRVAGYE